MKKRKSGYVKVSRNLFETKDMRSLKRAEKAEGIGVFMIIVMHLSKLENAIGDEETVKVISVMCSKSQKYIWHIIRDFNLFTIDGDEFQCTLLRKTFKVETTLGEFPDDDETPVIITEKCDGKSFLNATVDDSEMIPAPSGHYNVQAAAGASPIVKDSKIYDKRKDSSTDVLQKSTTTTTDFQNVVEKIFSMPRWLSTVENQMQIRISSDKVIRDFVRQRFVEEIEMNGSYDDGEPFNESRAKRYFVNWVRPGKPPRHELNLKINTMLRGEEVKKSEQRNKRPFEGFGSIDRDGRRRGPHDEIVPMDAPACMDVMMEWNEKRQRWD